VLCGEKEIKKIAFRTARALKGTCFPLDEGRGVWRITLRSSGLNLDISPVSGNLTEDLSARDFTVNAMALPFAELKSLKTAKGAFLLSLDKKKIVDPSGGGKDLQKKLIRASGKNVFREDPLRMLRAFRFASSLGFEIEKDTFKLIKEESPRIKESAGERIKEELLAIFASGRSASFYEEMRNSGLLFSLFPELKLQEKCAEIYYGKGGVLKHTFNVMKRMDLLFSRPGKFISKYEGLNIRPAGEKLLKLAALFHDIAKPHKAKEINGRLRFFGHEEYGAFLAGRLMRGYKFSNEETRFVTKIIAQHLRVGNIAHNDVISDKAIYKIFSDLGEYAIPLLLLSWADHASYIPEKKLLASAAAMKQKPFRIPPRGLPKTGFKKTLRFIQVVNYLIRYYFEKRSKFRQENLLDGHQVMKALELKPGPAVGEVLRRVKLMQFEGKLKNRKQALKYIKTLKV